MTEIFKGNDDVSIKVNFSNGGRYELERYDSKSSADMAMNMLCESIGKYDVFKMPSEKEINAKLSQIRDTVPHHIKGKKNKSYGGS